MIIPYLVFAGNCSEAIDFYEQAFDCKARMRQLYEDYVPEGLSEKPDNLPECILHAEMEVGGATLWLADEIQDLVVKGSNVKLTVTLPTKAEAAAVFAKLAAGGTISLPPTDTFYSTFHAALVDRYGNSWNIVAEEAPSPQ